MTASLRYAPGYSGEHPGAQVSLFHQCLIELTDVVEDMTLWAILGHPVSFLILEEIGYYLC